MRTEPRATYRVQLNADFTLDDAAAIVDYLDALGVSHLYASPILRAAPGSAHGYDVVDHSCANPELGGDAALARLDRALAARGMGILLDIVPNHMAIGRRENRWWWDVLKHGRASRFARAFDVDWEPPEERLRDVILLPILGDHYGKVLEAGEIRLAREDGEVVVRYGDHALPLAPGTLPEGDVDEAIARVNADVDALDRVLDAQHYRLARWRSSSRDLGYRRFFDIDSLVGLRVEDDAVFADTHARVLGWVREGVVDGLRVDHVDGLRDPDAYLGRLAASSGGAWTVVEKVVAPDERLPDTWPVAGTTGYDFLRRVAGLFVDPAGEEPLTRLHAEFTGEARDFARIAHEKKDLVARTSLGSDVNRLAELLVRICERHRRFRDYTRHELHDALREASACLDVYRSYVRASEGRVGEADRSVIDRALCDARRRRPDLDPELFTLLRSILLLELRGGLESEFVMRFQQLTPAVTAKGVEDTAFYTYLRLVALNEVGGDPARFGVSVAEFHAANAEAARLRPRALLATATHDTKRGEDVRLRIALLSEIPARWGHAVRRWSARNEPHRTGDLPDRAMEYLFYQTLVGAWPIETERLAAYMEKAAREAKARTSWTDPDAAYENALRRFVAAACADADFRADLESFLAPIAAGARVASLAHTLLKLTSPGVPDLYQGTELWQNHLVDPDNRRPVDYGLRRSVLDGVRDADAAEVLGRPDAGAAKLLVTARALALRRRRPELFGPGSSYEPLAARGERAAHVVAFVRGGGAVSVAPRLVLGLAGDWGDTTIALPDGEWRDVLAGGAVRGSVALRELLARFPVALLERA